MLIRDDNANGAMGNWAGVGQQVPMRREAHDTLPLHPPPVIRGRAGEGVQRSGGSSFTGTLTARTPTQSPPLFEPEPQSRRPGLPEEGS